MKERLYKILSIVLLVWAIISTIVAVNYYILFENLKRENFALKNKCAQLEKELGALSEKLITVNIAIDYGNGTVQWFNNTILPKGSSLFVATVLIAKVEYKVGAYGVYIVSINNVKEKIITPGKEGYSWIWYYYDPINKKWKWGPMAADKYILKDGDIVMWKYTHWKF